MMTNKAIVFAWVVLVAVFATGCGTGNAQASGGNDKVQARLEVKGSQGSAFSGSCAIGDGEAEEIDGEVPESFTYDLNGRPLDCEISSDGNLRVELTVGENARSLQSISGGTLTLTYEDGSISSTTSSSSRSGGEEDETSSRVTSSSQAVSSGGQSNQGPSGETNGPASLAEESRDVSEFDEVELRGIGNLSIEQTGSESLTVEAEEDILPKLRTEIVNDRLILGPEPGTTVHTAKPINYRLTVENLNALAVSGSGDVEAEGISADRLIVTIGGAGSADVGGEADEQEVEISGSGDYRAEDLDSKVVRIGVSGAGSAIVNTSEELDANVSGAGSVEYVGDPTVEQDTSGAGRVSKH